MDALKLMQPASIPSYNQRPMARQAAPAQLDSFQFSSENGAPMPAFKDMLKLVSGSQPEVHLGRGSAGGQLPGKYVQGEGAVDVRADQFRDAARSYSRQHAGERVDWAHPSQALHHISQIDGQSDTRYDEDRCGAAVLVAGAVLTGPKNFQQGLDNVINRATALGALTDTNRRFEVHSEELNKAIDTLEAMHGKNPKQLTNGDLEKIQDAVYVIANVDQQLNPQGNNFEPGYEGKSGLSSGAMKTYSKLLWNGQTPKMDGKPLHIEELQGAQVDHFVLAQGNNVAYNPWPEQSGAAYSRAADGAGARITNNAPSAQGGEVSRFPMGSMELPTR